MLHFRFYYSIILLFSSLFFVSVAAAQSPQMEAAARAQLAQRGISEDELREKLNEKGIDINAITPDQLPALQPTIEQAISEIEAEKNLKNSPGNAKTNTIGSDVPGPFDIVEPRVTPVSSTSTAPTEVKQVAAKTASEIKERVQDGATVQEAVTEALTDEANKNSGTSNIFGQDIFKNKTIDVYRTTKDARPTEKYILGIGDELSVIIFGASQGDFRFVINEEGYIDPPGVGKIFLKGVPYGKARDLIYGRFSRAFLFRKDQFIFSLATARTITVNIFGEVVNSGSFTLSAINTAFNAISACGGPNAIGSVRNIKVTRDGKSKNLDVYTFMNSPEVKFDYFLDNNDIIHIPVAEKVISIGGAVNRPAIYELKTNERLKDLVEFAGGVKPIAYTKRIQIKRHIADNTILLDVDFDVNADFDLQNGDEVIVHTIPQDAQNKVTVTGEVDYPGTYALERNLDLAALAFKANLKRTARRDLAFVVRQLTNGNTRMIQVDLDEVMQGKGQPFFLEQNDQLLVFRQERFVDALKVNISGAVREPATQPFNTGLKLSEYLLLSGGLRPDAADFGYILRKSTIDGSKLYMRINPIKAVTEPASDANILLQGDDNVHIYSLGEFREEAYVRVSGAVRNPVNVPYGTALTLSDVLKMSGGLRIGAAKGRVDIYSVVLQENQPSRSLAQSYSVEDDMGNIGLDVLLQPYDEIIVREIPDFELLKKVRIEGEVKFPGEYALVKDNERVSDIVARAGGLTLEAFAVGGTVQRTRGNIGLIITKMDQALKQRGSKYDLTLQEGDLITIPKSIDMVSILTANTDAVDVLSPSILNGRDRIHVAFEPGKRGRWYVREFAGGRSDHTSYRKMKVQYANGRIKKAINFGLFAWTPKVYPGAKIMLPYIPEKKKEDSKEPKKEKDWDKLFTQVLSFASVTATMVLAFAALNK